jgi:hypothetical protein
MSHQVDIIISTKIINKRDKYLDLSLMPIFIGPHISLCTSLNKSFDLSSFLIKDVLVILPDKHDSHIALGSKSKQSRSSISYSFLMHVSFI